jgi:iron complex transport system substrate-binding protein
MFTTFPCTRRICGVVLAGAFAVAAAGVAGATTEPPVSEPAPSEPAGTEPPGTDAATAGPDTGANPAGCVEGDAATGEQFPDQFTVQHAENYTLTYAETYKVLTVAEPDAGAHTYVLVQCGTEAPPLDGELDGATVVEIPVATVFSESTSHLGFIDVLDLEGTVTGVSDGAWVVTPSIRERIDAGEVESFNTTMVIDTELVVAADPDVYITGGYDDPAHEAIADAGVPVVANAEWLETTPEGWAEWVGLFAALTNTEAKANELYGAWVTDYDAAAALVAGATERPTVMTGGLYEGTWFANGGAGIAAEFIADAGGDYIYDDNEEPGSIELDIETVLTDAVDADVWVLASSFTTEDEAEAADPRNAEFAAWDEGGVWINSIPSDASVNPYEQGPVMIDEYLLDYIKILHPELVRDHELVFFSQVPQS